MIQITIEEKKAIAEFFINFGNDIKNKKIELIEFEIKNIFEFNEVPTTYSLIKVPNGILNGNIKYRIRMRKNKECFQTSTK